MPSDPGLFDKTLRHGVPTEEQGPALTGSTLIGVAPGAPVRVQLDDDLDAAPASPSAASTTPAMGTTVATRTTVLPRRSAQQASAAPGTRLRFERVRLLGEGGMGEVELARDNDIRRTVAVKRLKGEVRSSDALLRFADEVRVVGQLEHPAIVPIYDVGQDTDGELYLVMKHLHGETMERVIEGLQAREPAYVERFSITQRVQIFLAVLDAMRYAHSRGIIHRDLKPANIMIGPYGEVTILDWGIAKPIKARGPDSAASLPLDSTLLESQDGRLQDSKLGQLAGTPLYMSPEQASGFNDDLDERSDVYALCILLFEWLALQNPRRNKRTLVDLLGSIAHEDFPEQAMTEALLSGVSPQYLNLIRKGLVRDREQRLQSVADLEKRLQDIVAGRIPIECHVTLARRLAHDGLSWIDRHPMAFTVLFFGGLGAIAIAALWGVYQLLFR